MKKILTVAVTLSALAGVTAPAAYAQNEDVTMLTGKVFRALRDCDLDGNMVDTLTMAQVAGISIAASSEDESEKCVRIEAIALGEDSN